SAGHEGTLRLLDAGTGKEVRRLGHPNARCAAFSPDGKTALSGGWGADRTLRLWDLESGKELRRWGPYAAGVCAVAWSRGGKGYLLCCDKTFYLRDRKTGAECKRFGGHTALVHALATARGGKAVASASFDGTARVWDVETGKELRCFRGHKGQ